VKTAFTMDDLPLWPQSYPPDGYTAQGIVRAIQDGLAQHGISGVYAFANSWAIDKHPEFADILDDWVAAGHHIANHTHAHQQLPDINAAAFIADIAEGERKLARWLNKAPRKLFRHPLCHWGETATKLAAVNAYLADIGATPVDVTSWCYEWTWNRAYRAARDAGDRKAEIYVKDSFLTFSLAQLMFDQAAAKAWFGQDITAITLGHNVPFFADVAADYFGRLIDAGVMFVALEDALVAPVQSAVGSVVSDKFLVLQQKLADAAGRPTPQIVPECQEMFARIKAMAGDLTV